MTDRHSDSRRGQVTLEDLLRLKRAERPPAEFWAQFEGELRQRQLAALVEKKSWWHELNAVFARAGRLRLPLGATAILALTLVSVQRYSRSGGDPQPGVPDMDATESAGAVNAAPVARIEPVAVPAAAENRVAVVASAPARKMEATAPAQAAPAGLSGEVSGRIPWLGGIVLGRAATTDGAPMGNTLALSNVPAQAPEFAGAVASSLGFEERAMPAAHRRPTADILPTAAAAAMPRRARLLAVLDSAGASVNPDPMAPDRLARSAARYLRRDIDDRSMGRTETEGVGLSIRF